MARPGKASGLTGQTGSCRYSCGAVEQQAGHADPVRHPARCSAALGTTAPVCRPGHNSSALFIGRSETKLSLIAPFNLDDTSFKTAGHLGCAKLPQPGWSDCITCCMPMPVSHLKYKHSALERYSGLTHPVCGPWSSTKVKNQQTPDR